MDRVYLWTFYLFRFVVKATPRVILDPILNFVASVARAINAKHRKIIMANLDFAYGDTISKSEKERILKKCYQNLVMYGADFVRNQGALKDEVLRKVTFKNAHVLQEAKKSGRAIILQTAHYGNWELMALAVAAEFGAMSIVGRPLDSKAMDEILSENREQFDIELISKYGAMRAMLKALKSGRMLGILVDQSVGEGDGVATEFFGKKISHTHSISLLAKKMNALIVPLFITTDDYESYEVEIYEPIEPNDESIEQLTQKQTSVEEMVIRKKPDEWFWFHKKFKTYDSHIYN